MNSNEHSESDGEPPVDIAERLCGALESLAVHLATLTAPAAAAARSDLDVVVASIVALMAAPTRLEVTGDHRAAAVALVAGYLDGGAEHALLVELLGGYDRSGRGDPAFRLGLLAALTQLTADALVAASVAWAAAGDAELTESNVHTACLTLLQRLALLANRNGD